MNIAIKTYQANLAGKNALGILSVLSSIKSSVANLLLFRIRLIPIVIFFAVLLMSVKINTLIGHLSNNKDVQLFKQARAEPPPQSKTKPKSDSSAKNNTDDFDLFNMTSDQFRALQGVKDKRDQLGVREKSLSEKEQVLQALVKKMDEKIAELKTAKVDLKKLVDSIEEEENANTKRIIKMAEAMKPAQAAKVLETVEFPILLEVIEKMNEKKASAILAAMEAEKAGYLMTSLAKRRKLFKKDDPKKAIMR